MPSARRPPAPTLSGPLFGHINLFGPDLVQVYRDPSHFHEGPGGKRGTRDVVDPAGQLPVGANSRPLELVGEGGPPDLRPDRLAVDQYLDQLDLPSTYHKASCDWLGLPNLLQDDPLFEHFL